MLDNLRAKITNLFRSAEPTHNAQLLTPIGREYAIRDSYEDKRIDVEQLLATTEAGQVDSILLEIFNLMFSGWGLIPVPPDGMDPKEASNKSSMILKQLWRFDKILDTKYLMARTWVDNLAFGPGLVELGVQVDEEGNFLDWGRLDDWKGPEWANYLDATSFEPPASTSWSEPKRATNPGWPWTIISRICWPRWPVLFEAQKSGVSLSSTWHCGHSWVSFRHMSTGSSANPCSSYVGSPPTAWASAFALSDPISLESREMRIEGRFMLPPPFRAPASRPEQSL